MKRVIGIVGAVSLVALVTGSAQAKKMYAGIMGGANFASIGGDDAPENNSSRTLAQGGGYLRCEVDNQFGVRGEVLYVQKGVEGDIQTKDGDIHPGTASVDYIDVPILLDVSLLSGHAFGFDVFAGPSFNFNIKSEVDTEDGLEDRKDQTKSFEFGAVVGGGVRYNLSSLSLVADVRYSMGATSISDDVNGQSFDIKNRGIGVLAGLEIPLGSE